LTQSKFKNRDLFPFIDQNIAQVHLNKITGNITSGGLGSAQEVHDISHYIELQIKNPIVRGKDKYGSAGGNETTMPTDRLRSDDSMVITQQSMGGFGINKHANKSYQSTQKLVSSSINTSKMSFRSPFLKNQSTFGFASKNKGKNIYDPLFNQEFRGKDSPSPT